MKYIWAFLLLGFYSCSPKYEVVEQLSPGKYHLYGVTNQDVIIVITTLKLKKDQIVTLKYIKKNNGNIE